MGKTKTSTTQIMDKLPDTGKSLLLTDFKSLVKIGIVNSNLITTFTGFWLALYFTGAAFLDNWQVFLLTMAGTALVIAGGCIMNNWYDVDVDPIMDRTKSRPTVTGSAPLNQVLILGITSTVAGIVLLLFTTTAAAAFALFGWIVYVFFYTMWAKRKYTLNTIVGSFSGAAPPLIGWAAIDPDLDIAAVVLFLIMFIWQTPHFLALAMKKWKEYKNAGIPMLPVVHGFTVTKRQMVVYTACLLPLPFYLSSLGTAFLIIATVLNIGWLLLGIGGFFMKNDLKWANWMFIYSLNYLTIIFILMVAVTFKSPLS